MVISASLGPALTGCDLLTPGRATRIVRAYYSKRMRTQEESGQRQDSFGEASARVSPGSRAHSAIAALAFGFRFFSAIREMTRWPRRPQAQAGVVV